MRRIAVLCAIMLSIGGVVAGLRLSKRYEVAERMPVTLTEYSNFAYPEDPSLRSDFFGHYARRRLLLGRRDRTHFDFTLQPTDSRTAEVVFSGIDVGLMTPSVPSWVRGNRDLVRIAVTDRQWNRQQVSFSTNSVHLHISGGDGFETTHLQSAELAKNCLNAGLWEVLLYTREHGEKTLYYQAWFTFPLGAYKQIFEDSTGLSYLHYWSRLEHWRDPRGTPVDLDKLRAVLGEMKAEASFDPAERRFFAGEQVRKQRLVDAVNLRTWGDIVGGAPLKFAAFVPPGRYSVSRPWMNEYRRLAEFKGAVFRWVRSPASPLPLAEIELDFSSKAGETSRMIVSGIDISRLPRLAAADYSRGLSWPMGIGVPPFFQSYDELQENPPQLSPYFSVLLDSSGRWINHHAVAIDGPLLHRDLKDPGLIHLDLLSYERETLIGHYRVRIPPLPRDLPAKKRARAPR